MIPSESSLDIDRVRAAAGRHAISLAIDLRQSCESTNSALLDTSPAAPGVLQLLACETQTAGRGRRGRTWLSWGPGSLTFSVRWQFAPGAPAPMGLSLAAGVAVARACDALGARGIALKWPNDILFEGRKLGGLLTELSIDPASGTAAVIGIGLNLRRNGAPQVDVPIASLDEAIASLPDRSTLLGELVGQLGRMLQVFSGVGFVAFRDEWQLRNAHAGLPVQVIGERDAIHRGQCAGVDADGALLLDDQGVRRRVLSGDVSLRSA